MYVQADRATDPSQQLHPTPPRVLSTTENERANDTDRYVLAAQSGQVAGAAKGITRARSPSSMSACPTTFSQKPLSRITRPYGQRRTEPPERSFMPGLKRNSCARRTFRRCGTPRVVPSGQMEAVRGRRRGSRPGPARSLASLSQHPRCGVRARDAQLHRGGKARVRRVSSCSGSDAPAVSACSIAALICSIAALIVSGRSCGARRGRALPPRRAARPVRQGSADGAPLGSRDGRTQTPFQPVNVRSERGGGL
jgi:hypothetical protein